MNKYLQLNLIIFEYISENELIKELIRLIIVYHQMISMFYSLQYLII